MSLIVNLRHLAKHDLSLEGELSVNELELDTRDAMIHVRGPLRHELEVQKLEHSLLVHGRLRLTLDCQCVRCLKSFQHHVELSDWTCLLPLQGEDAAPVVNDCVDLTPPIREDILLAFPQHPVCDPQCRGLAKTWGGKAKKSDAGPATPDASTWAELDKLKL